MRRTAYVTVIILLVFVVVGGRETNATTMTHVRDIMTRQTVSLLADHVVTFVTPSGVDAPSDTITVGLPAFSFVSFAVNKFSLATDTDAGCDGPWTEKTLAASASTGVWGVGQSGTTVTLTAPTNATSGEIAENRCVRTQMLGLLTNPSTPGTYRVDVSGTFGDSGFGLVVALTSDAVQISATVPEPTPPTPPDTVVIFRGIAYPHSQVTIERQGTILVTVPADPQARFDVTLTNQPSGVWTYAVYAEDALGRVGRTSNFTLSITSGTTTTVSGVFLGPTIDADHDTIALSETATVFGATLPASAVTIFVSSEEEQAFQVTADADGVWVRQFLGSDVGLGDHHIRSKAVSPESEISAFSSTIPLTVTEETVGPCDGRNRADINCDGRVNLTDFSILLFFWRQRNPSNERADINSDTRVNLTDLSILLFNWTR